MGRARASLAQRTSVRAWAETTVFLGGGRTKKYLNFFAEPGSIAAPTTFHSCLVNGTPTPRLRHPDGQDGPALKIERAAPGSLKWLIHPLWTTFDLPCESIFEIHGLMAALSPPVADRLFDPGSPLLRRRERALKGRCEEFFEIGTLDALAALIYCGCEAVLTNDITAARAAERTLRQRLAGWSCLQHLSDATKRCLVVLCQDVIDSASLHPPRRGDAPWTVATRIVSKRFRGATQQDFVGRAEDIGLIEQVLRTP